MRPLIVVSLLLLATPLATPLALAAQEAEAERGGRGWSVGTSLTYPIVRIYQIHIGYRLDDRNEVFFGPAYQNFQSGSVTSHAYTLILGHRFYVWRELHLETELWPAINRMYSSETGMYYPGVELWAELKVGYDLPLYRGVYLKPAPGLGFGILRTNRPPSFGEDIRSPIFVPQLMVGVAL
jgi:hypothetical protein